MRIYENNFAYELERVVDTAIQVETVWRYNLYQVRPLDRKISSGEVATMGAAERKAKRAIAKLIKVDATEEKLAA